MWTNATVAVNTPDTIWWTDTTVFGDSEIHEAPPSCDCCRFSGLHTNCKYTPPSAAPPQQFGLSWGQPVEGFLVDIGFSGGMHLSEDDFAELRPDMHCGYDMKYTLRSQNLTLSTNGSTTGTTLRTTLPPKGCYSVCYYQINIDVPTWVHLGTLDVLSEPTPPRGFNITEGDVVVAGVTVQIEVSLVEGALFDIFSETLSLVGLHSGGCGVGTAVITSLSATSDDTSELSRLLPLSQYPWCSPEVTAKVSPERPHRYLPIKYSDCAATSRLKVPAVSWRFTPPAGDYQICYLDGSGVSTSLGALYVPFMATVHTALMALYEATNGENWLHRYNWGSEKSVCSWYGVRCGDPNDVTAVTEIVLERNRLRGVIPQNFTLSELHTTVRSVGLAENELEGEIPEGFGVWGNLTALDLGGNNLTGSVPVALQKAPLRTLYLQDNALYGRLPYGLRSLGTLRQIFTEGSGGVGLEVPQAAQYTTSPTEPVVDERLLRCPRYTYYCPALGSADPYVQQCGNADTTQAACLALHCCWSPFASQGKPCHTTKRTSAELYPICKGLDCISGNATVV